MTQQPPIVSVKNISLTYQSGHSLFRKKSITHALQNVSFNIYQGETLGIIGRNGSGKSTLLKLLNKTILADRGHIEFNNHMTTLLSLNIGYNNLISGRHNAIIQGMMMGTTKEKMLANMDEIIAFSELEQFIDQPIKNYSTGMQQKLGFGVALKVKTDLLLIDESLAVGDASFKIKSRKSMEEKINSGDSVVLVSHYETDIEQLCNRVVWLEKGKIHMLGETAPVIAAYKEALV